MNVIGAGQSGRWCEMMRMTWSHHLCIMRGSWAWIWVAIEMVGHVSLCWQKSKTKWRIAYNLEYLWNSNHKLNTDVHLWCQCKQTLDPMINQWHCCYTSEPPPFKSHTSFLSCNFYMVMRRTYLEQTGTGKIMCSRRANLCKTGWYCKVLLVAMLHRLHWKQNEDFF